MYWSSQRRRVLSAFLYFTSIYIVVTIMLFILAVEFEVAAAVVAVQFITSMYELTGIIGLGALMGLLPAQLFLDVLGVLFFGFNFIKRR